MGYDIYRAGSVGNGDDRDYYRANVWLMQVLRVAMEEAGAAFSLPDFSEVPEWPDMESVGPEFDSSVPPTTDAERAYVEQCEAVRRFHGPETPGIPLHKLGSNDGWLITEAEAASAADLFERFLDDNPAYFLTRQLDYFEESADPPRTTEDAVTEEALARKWVAYLRYVSTRGGAEVW